MNNRQIDGKYLMTFLLIVMSLTAFGMGISGVMDGEIRSPVRNGWHTTRKDSAPIAFWIQAGGEIMFGFLFSYLAFRVVRSAPKPGRFLLNLILVMVLVPLRLFGALLLAIWLMALVN